MPYSLDDLRKRILYIDGDLLLVHKPGGLAVQHAGVGTPDLENAMRTILAEKEKSGRIPWLSAVHRLDQPVEGLVLFARNAGAAGILGKQLQEGSMKKVYLTGLAQRPEIESADLRHYMIRDGKAKRAFVVEKGRPGAKRADLSYSYIGERGGLHLLRVCLGTGRFHQIRCQLAEAGMPIVGDRKYNPDAGNKPMALCGNEIIFRHPASGRQVNISLEANRIDWIKAYSKG